MGFIDKFDLRVSNLDDIRVCAVHYTSNNDKNKSVLDYGLCDLQYSLSANTPLKQFLLEHEIHFDIARRIMAVGAKKYDISFERGNYDLDNPVTWIARKVYFDNALSCFLYIEDVTRYLGEVHIRPEILYDIDRLCPNLNLSLNWAQRCIGYEVKFASPIELFENYSFRDDDRPLYEALIDKALLVAGEMSSGEVCAFMKPLSAITRDQILSICKLY